MTAAVGYSSLSVGAKRGPNEGRLAELAKQEQALSQKLAAASKANPPPPTATPAESISREIIGVQAQIEQIILEAQLSRLKTSDTATPTSSVAAAPEASSAPKDGLQPGDGKDAKGKSTPTARNADGNGALPGGSKPAEVVAAQYKLQPSPTKHLDEKA